jgi:hypothetical protein
MSNYYSRRQGDGFYFVEIVPTVFESNGYNIYTSSLAKVNEEKGAARERAIQNNTRGAKNASNLARTKEGRLFRSKAKQLDEEALIEIE